jgi:hypothetical protein
MPDQETIVQETAAEEWDQPLEELPPRPRRRLFGAGVSPVPLALLAVFLIACGFIGGVLVQKGQEGSSSSGGATGGFASRLAGLRTGARSAGATGGTGASTAGATGAFGAARGNATTGKVTFIQGKTLYVETTEGTTVKVQTSAASAVTKTVKGTVHSIKPGETVVVTGSKASSGAVQAESIRVGSTGATGLFGGAATTTGSTTTGKSSSEPQLFGPGG